jgi:hypothetical protein
VISCDVVTVAGARPYAVLDGGQPRPARKRLFLLHSEFNLKIVECEKNCINPQTTIWGHIFLIRAVVAI